MKLSISFHISDTYQYPYPSTIVISIQVISISKWSLKTILKYDIIHIIPYKWYLSIWVCVKTPGPRWICGSLLFNRVLNGGIEREVLNGGITGGIERRAFPKQTSHVTNGSKHLCVCVCVCLCVCGVCGVCVCVRSDKIGKMAPTLEA